MLPQWLNWFEMHAPRCLLHASVHEHGSHSLDESSIQQSWSIAEPHGRSKGHICCTWPLCRRSQSLQEKLDNFITGFMWLTHNREWAPFFVQAAWSSGGVGWSNFASKVAKSFGANPKLRLRVRSSLVLPWLFLPLQSGHGLLLFKLVSFHSATHPSFALNFVEIAKSFATNLKLRLRVRLSLVSPQTTSKWAQNI